MMEKFQEHREEANKRLKVADHLLTVTYPLVKDPKLLLTVMENLYSCYENGMNSVLEHQAHFKNLDVLPKAFQPRFTLFKTEIIPTFKIDGIHAEAIMDLHELMVIHKDSPVEFSKNDKFVICTDNYRVKTITVKGIKKYIASAKDFVEELDRVIK